MSEKPLRRLVIENQGPEFNVLATSELDEMCWASPAVVGDRLLIRTLDHLYCIGQ